jgi:hypothetical protein
VSATQVPHAATQVRLILSGIAGILWHTLGETAPFVSQRKVSTGGQQVATGLGPREEQLSLPDRRASF